MKKYNLSVIMKRAWELVKKEGKTISEGLKQAWAEAKKPSKEQIIEKLEAMGASRWTKYGKDRMYFNRYTFMENAGFEYHMRKTGSISEAYVSGIRVSNAEGVRILYGFDCTYLNLETMQLESRGSINDNVREMIEAAMAA